MMPRLTDADLERAKALAGDDRNYLTDIDLALDVFLPAAVEEIVAMRKSALEADAEIARLRRESSNSKKALAEIQCAVEPETRLWDIAEDAVAYDGREEAKTDEA